MRGVLGLIFVLLGVGSDGVAQESSKNQVYSIHRLITSSLRFRRPDEGVPVSGLGCQTGDRFFKSIDLRRLRECLSEAQGKLPVFYDLKRSSQPVLRLNEDEPSSACLKAALFEIPVPREIVFESNETGVIQCYSVRLKVEANEWVGARFPIHGVSLRLRFPMTHVPQKDEDLLATLISWSLTPYWEENPITLFGVLVPDAVCNECIGEKMRIRGAVHPSQLWP